MVKIQVEGREEFQAAVGMRLVNAIEGHGIDILHRCGGNAKCTTCRVSFIEGEPERMTEAEKTKLAEKGLADVRLSCQILCDHDMHVKVINTLSASGLPDPGGKPEAHITPDAVWTTRWTTRM